MYLQVNGPSFLQLCLLNAGTCKCGMPRKIREARKKRRKIAKASRIRNRSK